MKNNEKLLYTIGEVKDKSVPDVPEKRPSTFWMKMSALGCGVAAAALLGVVILGGGGREQPPHGYTSEPVTNYDPGQSTDDNSETTTEQEPAVNPTVSIYPEFSYQPEEKELVSFSANINNLGSKGVEGFGAYDNELEEMLSQNPWNESMELEALPVYHNAVLDNWLSKTAFIYMYLSEEQMNAMAENVAYLLGTEIASRDTFYDVYLEGFNEPPTPEQVEAAPSMPYQLNAKCADGTEIQVDGAGQIWILLEPSVQHPDGYGLDESETKQECMDYLTEKFSGLLQFEAPKAYAYSLNINSMTVYDSAGGDVQRILNYSLYNARFYGDADGDLSQIYIDNAFVATEYMGDYPIITPDEAREMLLDGKFVANIWDGYIKNGVISEEDIGGVELLYRYAGRHEENYQPYYCFYVELDREEEFYENFPGLTYYGSFYVPAVSEEYIGELTQWYTFSEPAENQYGNYGKDNYQEDPYEFIGGIQQVVKDSDTIEGMYQALREFDTNGRIDKILISFDGVPITAAEGELKEGMLFEVYYDNEASWFEFKL